MNNDDYFYFIFYIFIHHQPSTIINHQPSSTII